MDDRYSLGVSFSSKCSSFARMARNLSLCPPVPPPNCHGRKDPESHDVNHGDQDISVTSWATFQVDRLEIFVTVGVLTVSTISSSRRVVDVAGNGRYEGLQVGYLTEGMLESCSRLVREPGTLRSPPHVWPPGGDKSWNSFDLQVMGILWFTKKTCSMRQISISLTAGRLV